MALDKNERIRLEDSASILLEENTERGKGRRPHDEEEELEDEQPRNNPNYDKLFDD